MTGYREPDLTRLRTVAIGARPNKVDSGLLAAAPGPGRSFHDFLDSLPHVLAADHLRTVAAAIVSAHRARRAVVVLAGGHVIAKRGDEVILERIGVTLGGHPVPGHTVRLDTQELAAIVSSTVDHVTVSELADWIVRGDTQYRLVDVRTPEEFAAYHIPTAENVPIAALPDYGLARNEKIVLYSDGGTHSAQAWMLLRAERYQGVYILFGGLETWKDDGMFPVAPVNPT